MNTFAAACFGVMMLAMSLRTQVDSQNTTAAPTMANQTTASTGVNVTTLANVTASSATNATTPNRAAPGLQPAISFILIAMVTSLIQCC